MKHDEIVNKILSGDILSEYNHTNIITRKNNRDFMQFDCSGFIAWYIGTNGYLRALAEIKGYLRSTDFLKINRFYCQDFERIYNHPENLHYWKIHKNILDIDCDDILITIYDDGNGHMMIVDKIISRSGNDIELRIVDSTRLLHKNDTRNQSGIGYGDIKITLDNDGILYDPQNPKRTPTYVRAYIARPIK